MKNKNNGFGLIGILIVVGIIAVVGGGGYYFKNTMLKMEQSSDFKNYGREVENISDTINKKVEDIKSGTEDKIKDSEEERNLAIEKLKQERVDNVDRLLKSGEDNFLIYKNEKYGFSLILPKRWEGYTVEEKSYGLSFGLKKVVPYIHNDGTREEYGSIFVITIYSPEDWEINQNANDPSVSTYLANNDKYFFGYSKGHDDMGFVGFPLEIDSLGHYDGPYDDVSNIIIPSFKFID